MATKSPEKKNPAQARPRDSTKTHTSGIRSAFRVAQVCGDNQRGQLQASVRERRERRRQEAEPQGPRATRYSVSRRTAERQFFFFSKAPRQSEVGDREGGQSSAVADCAASETGKSVGGATRGPSIAPKEEDRMHSWANFSFPCSFRPDSPPAAE